MLCNVKQYYLVAMVILPEGASGLEIFFKSSFIRSQVKRKQCFYVDIMFITSIHLFIFTVLKWIQVRIILFSNFILFLFIFFLTLLKITQKKDTDRQSH